MVGDGLIESQGWLDAVPVQHRENAEDTNTVAILVVAVAADVGKVVVRRISGPQALGPAHGTHWKWRVGRHLPVPVLEVDNDGKGDTSVVRPSEDGTRDNGGPWIKILIHPVASARRHGSASSPCCSDNLGSGHDCQEAGETEFRSASGDAGQWIALPRRRGLAGDVGETDCPHVALTKRCRSDPRTTARSRQPWRETPVGDDDERRVRAEGLREIDPREAVVALTTPSRTTKAG